MDAETRQRVRQAVDEQRREALAAEPRAQHRARARSAPPAPVPTPVEPLEKPRRRTREDNLRRSLEEVRASRDVWKQRALAAERMLNAIHDNRRKHRRRKQAA